eukprot:2927910-Prymnesium_polylepis.2
MVRVGDADGGGGGGGLDVSGRVGAARAVPAARCDVLGALAEADDAHAVLVLSLAVDARRGRLALVGLELGNRHAQRTLPSARVRPRCAPQLELPLSGRGAEPRWRSRRNGQYELENLALALDAHARLAVEAELALFHGGLRLVPRDLVGPQDEKAVAPVLEGTPGADAALRHKASLEGAFLWTGSRRVSDRHTVLRGVVERHKAASAGRGRDDHGVPRR